jgi:hypothetical protein
VCDCILIWSTNFKSLKCSDREELVPERSLDPLIAVIKMYKNRYGNIPILVFMFGGYLSRVVETQVVRQVE